MYPRRSAQSKDWSRIHLQGLNAEGKEELSDDSGYSKHFTYKGTDPNTVMIFVRYLPHADRELLNLVVNNAKQLVQTKAARRGWSWVRVGEDVLMVESPSKREK